MQPDHGSLPCLPLLMDVPRTEVRFHRVGNLDRAKEWYGLVLGIRPYFDEPFYVGFNVGGFELGLQPDGPNVPCASTGVIAYWGVDDANAAVGRLPDTRSDRAPRRSGRRRRPPGGDRPRPLRQRARRYREPAPLARTRITGVLGVFYSRPPVFC